MWQGIRLLGRCDVAPRGGGARNLSSVRSGAERPEAMTCWVGVNTPTGVAWPRGRATTSIRRQGTPAGRPTGARLTASAVRQGRFVVGGGVLQNFGELSAPGAAKRLQSEGEGRAEELWGCLYILCSGIVAYDWLVSDSGGPPARWASYHTSRDVKIKTRCHSTVRTRPQTYQLYIAAQPHTRSNTSSTTGALPHTPSKDKRTHTHWPGAGTKHTPKKRVARDGLHVPPGTAYAPTMSLTARWSTGHTPLTPSHWSMHVE